MTRRGIVMWFIAGRTGLYNGGTQTPDEAIALHTRALCQSWDYCERRGDRVIQCLVTRLATRPRPPKGGKG